MSDMTPLEEAEAFLRLTDTALAESWLAKVWDGKGRFYRLTYGTVRALVTQVKLDEQRLRKAADEIRELRKS